MEGYSVLDQHHAKNGIPRAPNPKALQLAAAATKQSSAPSNTKALQGWQGNVKDSHKATVHSDNSSSSDDSEEDESDQPKSKRAWHYTHTSANAPAKPTHLQFYPPQWQRLLVIA